MFYDDLKYVIKLHTLQTCVCVCVEVEVCKLETLLQSEVSVVGVGEGSGADGVKVAAGLRRRKRTCSRRAAEREGPGGASERAERGITEDKDIGQFTHWKKW